MYEDLENLSLKTLKDLEGNLTLLSLNKRTLENTVGSGAMLQRVREIIESRVKYIPENNIKIIAVKGTHVCKTGEDGDYSFAACIHMVSKRPQQDPREHYYFLGTYPSQDKATLAVAEYLSYKQLKGELLHVGLEDSSNLPNASNSMGFIKSNN